MWWVLVVDLIRVVLRTAYAVASVLNEKNLCGLICIGRDAVSIEGSP